VEALRGRGTAVVIATHDAELAAEIGDRVLAVERGRVVEAQLPQSLGAVTVEPMLAQVPA
jgi:ABC-type glutathione transport system ATPase component